MEQKKGFFESKIVKSALALIVGGLSYLGVSVGYLNPDDLNNAQVVYPEIGKAVELVKAGQWLSAAMVLISALVIYFRLFKTTKIISLSLDNRKREAA